MKKFVYLCLITFMIMQASELKECQNEQDKISGCIAKTYDENGNLGLEIVYKDGVAISGKCANGKKLTSAHLHNFTNGDGVSCN
ncbi:hypothetical protein [Helicobacter trogontum]|uniref:Uncharacterized protein n=1 Tax=Helicobacter trogontum TaxID=50960 RepID=A0A4U8TFW0_9HELI|nr:hypothetical protein [Helicobacter trogontum]MCI5787514.1 hypothetical protein [Helicobacter trogontum]MDY5185075.1 hypothetical protein [Helicobacter trogontum]TLD98554.1 hypothetical protein LS80_004435 [Helicobacter trogontum]